MSTKGQRLALHSSRQRYSFSSLWSSRVCASFDNPSRSGNGRPLGRWMYCNFYPTPCAELVILGARSNGWRGVEVSPMWSSGDPGCILCARKHQSEVNDQKLPTRGIVWFFLVLTLITQACILSCPVAILILATPRFWLCGSWRANVFDAASLYFSHAQELLNAAEIAGLQLAEHHWSTTIPARISAVYRNCFNQRKANITKDMDMLWWKPL